MLAEIVCAVAFLMTLRHVLALLEQNTELDRQVLFLTYKVHRLHDISDAWRMLGRRRPSARMRVAVYHHRKSDVSCAAVPGAPMAGEGAGAGDITSSTSCMASGGIMHSERRLSPCFDVCARTGVAGSTAGSSTGSDSSSCRASTFAARRRHKHGERSCSESGSSSG